MTNDRYLFRGKRFDNGKWTIGFLVYTGNFPEGNENDSELRNYWVITNGYTQHEIDPATIGRCTGATAKKSYRGERVEDLLIFEGDILKDRYDRLFTVEWEDCRFLAICRHVTVQASRGVIDFSTPCNHLLMPISCDSASRSAATEIVGNIHDGRAKCY